MQEFCFNEYKISCSSDEIQGNLKLNKTSNLKTQTVCIHEVFWSQESGILSGILGEKDIHGCKL